MAFTPKLGRKVQEEPAQPTTTPAFAPKLGKRVDSGIQPTNGSQNPAQASTGAQNESWKPTFGRIDEFQKKEKGFLGNVWDDLKARAGDVKETFGRVWDEGQNPLSTGVQVAGAAAGFVGDVAGQALTSAYKTVTPEAAQKAIQEKAIDLAKKAGLPEVMEKYDEWANAHPEASANLEGVLNIASLFPAERIASTTGKAAIKAGAPVVEKAAGKAALEVEKRAAKQALDKAMDATKPVLSKIETEEAIAAGRGKKGLFKTVLEPSKEDVRIAETVQDVVKGDNPFDDIQAVKGKIKTTSEDIRKVLAADKSGYNKNQIRSMLQKAKDESRIVFGSDKTQQSAYDAVVDEMMRQVDKQPQNLEGLWNARQKFDDVIEDKFPGLLGNPAGDNVRRNAVKDVRRALNQFIDAEAPDSAFAKGMKQMTDMNNAIERISVKSAQSMDKNILERASTAISRHPLVAGASLLGLGAGAPTLLSLVANPAAISGLALYGTYRVGKKVVTSKAVKDGLSTILRGIERGAAKAQGTALKRATGEVDALKAVIEALPD